LVPAPAADNVAGYRAREAEKPAVAGWCPPGRRLRDPVPCGRTGTVDNGGRWAGAKCRSWLVRIERPACAGFCRPHHSSSESLQFGITAGTHHSRYASQLRNYGSSASRPVSTAAAGRRPAGIRCLALRHWP